MGRARLPDLAARRLPVSLNFRSKRPVFGPQKVETAIDFIGFLRSLPKLMTRVRFPSPAPMISTGYPGFATKFRLRWTVEFQLLGPFRWPFSPACLASSGEPGGSKGVWRHGFRGLACIIATASDTQFSPIDVRRDTVPIGAGAVLAGPSPGRSNTSRTSTNNR